MKGDLASEHISDTIPSINLGRKSLHQIGDSVSPRPIGMPLSQAPVFQPGVFHSSSFTLHTSVDLLVLWQL